MFEQKILDSIQVIEHSGIRIDTGTVIYIDPINVSGAPHDADLILFTHPHFDHFSPKDVKKIIKDSTVIAVPKSMAAFCVMLLHKKPVTLLPDQTVELAGIPITTVLAYNKAKPFHMKPMKWLGYILTLGETRVYISGDTDLTDEARNVSCDIAMLPIVGCLYTIDAVQAAQLANEIKPHTVIPVHYGTFLGGEEASKRFKAALTPDIQADIRSSAFSKVMVSMYKMLGIYFALGIILIILLCKLL